MIDDPRFRAPMRIACGISTSARWRGRRTSISARTLDENMAIFQAAEVTARARCTEIDQLDDEHIQARAVCWLSAPDDEMGSRVADAQRHPAAVRDACAHPAAGASN